MSDRLVLELLHDILQVVGRRRKRGDPAARESDLGRGGELVDQIRIAGSLAGHEDLDQMILPVIVQMMNAVGIVPEDTEVRRSRLEFREAADRLIRVGIAGRVAVLGHAPDSLDRLVLAHQLLDHVHIGAAGIRGNRDHLYAKILCDRKVPVIAGNRAKELDLVQLAPGRIAHDTVCHGSGYSVIHDVQRGIAVDNDVVRIVLHHIADQDLCFMYAGQDAVVAAVSSVFTS